MIEEEVRAGRIRHMRPIDLLMNIMSLTISVFIVAPKGFASGECDSNLRKKYLESRKEEIKELIINGMRP